MFAKFGLRIKILALGLFLCIISLCVGLLSYHYLREVKSEYSFLPEKVMPKLEQMNDMFLNYRRLRIVIRTLAIPGLSASQAQEALTEVAKIIEEYESHDRAYVSLGFVPGQKELYDKVHGSWLAFKKVGEEAISLYRTGTPEGQQKMIEIFLTECPARAKDYTEAIHALETFHKGVAQTKAATANEISEAAVRMVFLIISIGTLMGLGLSFVFSKALSGALARICQDVGNATQQTSAASTQLAAASEQLSGSATETASSLEEIVASLEEVSSMVKLNSQSASQASEISQASRETAQQGEREISKLISTMNEMAESSKKIEEITNVIDDIAFQTNLLALNAAVEAARAGDHGKGFTVVAEAVRALAQRSASAAKDIADLIKETVAKTRHGASVASESRGVLNQILEATGKVATLNREIATGTQEQSNGLQQISLAMNQLDQATQVNSASAIEVASSSEEMASQADSLSEMVVKLQEVIEGESGKERPKSPIRSDDSALPLSLPSTHSATFRKAA